MCLRRDAIWQMRVFGQVIRAGISERLYRPCEFEDLRGDIACLEELAIGNSLRFLFSQIVVLLHDSG